MTLNTLVRAAAGMVALAGFGTAAMWSLRLARADYWARQASVEGLKKAIAITPGQEEYYYRLALLVAVEDGDRAAGLFKRAVELQPLDARSWIELGLHSEAEGDYSAAERYLLRAAELDRAYLPRWTMANYYFRRGQISPFWLWAKSSAGLLNGDAVPLFRLCEAVDEESDPLDRMEVKNPELRARYLRYLLSGNHSDRIAACARRLLIAKRSSDIPLLISACDRLLGLQRVSEALDIWNRLAGDGAIRYAKLDTEASPLTNGNFAVSPTSRAFDWRLPPVEGVSAARHEPTGLQLTFSGSQPENARALEQIVPVNGGAVYVLRFRYRASGIAEGAGPAWRVLSADGAITLAKGESLHSAEAAEGRLRFPTPPAAPMVRVLFECERRPGRMRTAGSILLWDVRLERD